MNRHQRRKSRTYRLLKETTKKLLVQKGYQDLTIQDISDTADVARGTFYVHFHDKDDAVWAVAKDVFLQLQTALTQLPTPMSPDVRYCKWLLFFRLIEAHQPLLHVILGERGNSVLINRLIVFLNDVVRENLEEHPVEMFQEVPTTFAAQFLAGALTRILVWWFEQDEQVSPEQMAKMFCSIVIPGHVPTIDCESIFPQDLSNPTT